MKPWLEADDIVILKEVMRAYAGTGGPLEILEWGAGGSTLMFPAFLHTFGACFRWMAIEHDQNWYSRVRGKIRARAREGRFPKGNVTVHYKPLLGNGDLYVSLPGDKKFDIIIVDGRYRRRCLVGARQLLKPTGLLLLHDAERSWYQCAMAGYEHQAMLTTSGKVRKLLWAACLDPAQVPVHQKRFS